MVVSLFLTHLLLEVYDVPFLLLHSAVIDLQEAKNSIDEEDPRPTNSI